MGLRLIESGIVAASASGGDLQSLAFPGICVLPSGRWICSLRAAPIKSGTTERTLLTWSDDEGISWNEPRESAQPPLLEGKTGRFRCGYLTSLGEGKAMAVLAWVDDSNPELPFFNPETEGILDMRICLAVSDDEGGSWSEARVVDTSPFNCPTAITGPVIQLANGGLALQFEINKTYYDTSVWRHYSVLLFSRDGGVTWPDHTIASNDPTNRVFYWDQRPARLADGRILDLFWTYDNKSAVYSNIHARESLDNGLSWSEMWDTGVPGQPSQPVSLANEELAMAYVDRSGAPAIKVRTSSDWGRSWPEGSEILVYEMTSESQTCNKGSMEDAWSEMSKFSVGLPATATCVDGDMLVVYYSGPDTDHTDIRWARLSLR